MNDYTAQMIEKEYGAILKLIGDKEGIGGPNSKDRTQILKTKAWGTSAIERTVWNADGIIVRYDVYAMKDGQLIWEHEEPNKNPKVNFRITVLEDGSLERADLTKPTPVPTRKPTPVPTATSVPVPTEVPTKVPTATPVPEPTEVMPTAVPVEPTETPVPPHTDSSSSHSDPLFLPHLFLLKIK